MNISPQAIGVGLALFIIPRIIANYVDPIGNRVSRSIHQRFWTITIPDNGVFYTYVFAYHVNWTLITILKPTETLLIITILVVLILGLAKSVELGRITAAQIFEKVSQWDKMPRTGRAIAFAISKHIGPRDFYAVNHDGTRPLLGIEWLFQKLGLGDPPNNPQQRPRRRFIRAAARNV